MSFVYVVANGALDWGPAQAHRAGADAVVAGRTIATTIRRVGIEAGVGTDGRASGAARLMGTRSTSATTGLEGLDHNFLTGKLEDLVKWARSRSSRGRPPSVWPAAPSR